MTKQSKILGMLAIVGLSVTMLFTVIACKKDKPDNPDDPSANMQTINLIGFVKDKSGFPLSGVKVTTGTATAMTDGKGEYRFSEAEVVSGRMVMKFEKEDYFTLTRSCKKESDLYIGAVLCPKGNSDISLHTTFDASKEGNLKIGGMKVDIAPSSIVRADGSAYSGTVTADMLYLEPNNEDFPDMMPGSDLKALNSGGNETSLISYGMINVLLADDAGNPLQLKSGSPANVTYPIPAGMERQAPATMPFWHFDEEKGIWIEDGVATLQGNVYVGTASHFSWHNLDNFTETAYFSINLSKNVSATFKVGQIVYPEDLPTDFREEMEKLNLTMDDLFGDMPKPDGLGAKLIKEIGRYLTGQIVKRNPEGFTTVVPEGVIGIRGKSAPARGTDIRDYWIVLCEWEDKDGKSGEYIGVWLPSVPVKKDDFIDLGTIVLGEGHEFTEIEEIQVIPPGKQETFMMGCQDDECSWDGNDKPVHQVMLSSYYINKYPITQLLWELVMGELPHINPADVCYDCPMQGISWDDAQDFITKLNQKTGKKYRLPTEAEWEYAARGGAKSKGYKYSGGNDIDVVAWYWDNANHKVHPVGTKAPNELGIYDMSGNIFEWCYDWYDDYTESSQTDPIGAALGEYRVMRGGSYGSTADRCRVAARYNHWPSYNNMGYGLRLVRVD